MDSRDSSSMMAPSPSAVSREGQSMDDDGVFSLAKDAAVYFQAQKYAESLQVLKQLLFKKPGDPKVLHNIAVTEYLCDGCSNWRKLLNELCNVKTRCEELAHSAEDLSEAGYNAGSKPGSISKGDNSTLMSGGDDFKVYSGEFDTSVASLNISVAQHICLLLLDAGLALQNATNMLLTR